MSRTTWPGQEHGPKEMMRWADQEGGIYGLIQHGVNPDDIAESTEEECEFKSLWLILTGHMEALESTIIKRLDELSGDWGEVE